MTIARQQGEQAFQDSAEPASASQLFDTHMAERLWRDHYGSGASARKFASELDAIFLMTEDDGAEALLRIADNRDNTVDLQASLLSHVEEQDRDCPVPRIRTTLAGRAFQPLTTARHDHLAVLATSFLPGRAIAQIAPSHALQTALFTQLAELDRALENFSHPSAQRALLWDVSHASRVTPMLAHVSDEAVRELAERALRDWTAAAPSLSGLRRQVIHNDFNPSNVLANADGIVTGIIDFGDALDAPSICDLATALAYQEPDQGFARMLGNAVDAYERLNSLTNEEHAILPVLIQARAAMVVAITHCRASIDPGNRAYLLRNAPLAARVLKAASSERSIL